MFLRINVFSAPSLARPRLIALRILGGWQANWKANFHKRHAFVSRCQQTNGEKPVKNI
jgi:hypothetical protein